MGTFEKKVIWAAVILIIFGNVACSHLLNAVNDAGGVRQVIIDTGKEFKSISEEISKGE